MMVMGLQVTGRDRQVINMGGRWTNKDGNVYPDSYLTVLGLQVTG